MPEILPAAKEVGSKYDMEIVSIDVAGSAAAVKVHNLCLNRRFVDYLHLAETSAG